MMPRILISRPQETAKNLAQKIKKLGCHPLIFPALKITKIQNTSDIQKIHACLSCLYIYHKIIFISPAAVENFAVFYTGFKKIPENIQLFAIGHDTALKIREKNLGKNIVYPSEKFNRENLLGLFELQADHIKNKKILICQGKAGNFIIKNTLETRGAEITALELYQTALPQPKRLPDLNTIDLMICTNTQSLENLLLLLGTQIKNQKFLVSSEKIQALMHSLKFKYPPLLAKHAGDEAILAALKLFMAKLSRLSLKDQTRNRQ